MLGMFRADSMIELWAIPPVRLASQAVNALAAGMKVGFGFSGSCSVWSWTCRRGLVAPCSADRVVERLHDEHDHRALATSRAG